MIEEILGNRYRIIRDLGSGGTAWVYLAEDTNDGRLVAVKVLYPQYSLDMAYLQRFVREAKVASSLTNPHIVRVLDYGATRDIHYLVMEHIGGQNLKDILASRGPLPWREALHIARQVALALDHASQYGIVHRDIKPHNLMIAENGDVKVLDFGIARALSMPTMTQSGFVGSPYYIAPEQAKGEPVDVRSDIYSLGIVLFEMLTGRVPFDADNPWAVISQHITDPPPSLRERNEDIPVGLEQLIETALAKRREERFQSPQEVIEVIDALLAGEDMPPGQVDVRPGEILSPVTEDIYQRGLQAVQVEQWEQAINLFSHVLELQPDYRDARERLAHATNQSALQNLHASAVQAMDAEQWEAARSILQELMTRDPDYADASSLLERVNARLASSPAEEAPSQEREPAVSPPTEQGEAAPPVEPITRQQVSAVRPTGLRPMKVIRTRLRRGRIRAWWLGVLIAFLTGSVFLGTVVLFEQQRQQSLRAAYEKAVAFFDNQQWDQAVNELSAVLARSPDYEDAASLYEDAVKLQELETLYEQGRAQYESGNTAEAITLLTQIRAQDPHFKQASVTGLLCDAYYQQARELSLSPETRNLQGALALLEKALEACPTNTEILAEQKWLEDYLQAIIYIGEGKWDEGIAKLKTLDQMDPSSADPRISKVLYQAYMDFGRKREYEGNLAAALLHYERALEVPDVDHGEAEQRRQELEQRLALLTPTPTSTAVPRPPTPTESIEETPTPTPNLALLGLIPPTREIPPIKYEAPVPVSPDDGAIYTGGEFEKIILDWEGPEELAPEEYYDVTVLRFYNNEPMYWGTNVRDSQIELSPAVGYGQADKDIFHWYVTIRYAVRYSSEGKPDGPAISPQSEARTFVWR